MDRWIVSTEKKMDIHYIGLYSVKFVVLLYATEVAGVRCAALRKISEKREREKRARARMSKARNNQFYN
jgi:hypothetical protein